MNRSQAKKFIGCSDEDGCKDGPKSVLRSGDLPLDKDCCSVDDEVSGDQSKHPKSIDQKDGEFSVEANAKRSGGYDDEDGEEWKG